MTLVDPSGGQLLFASLPSFGKSDGNSLFLRATFLNHLRDVFGNGPFGLTFGEWHNYFFFLGLVPKVLSIARPTGLRATPSFVPIAVPSLRTAGVAAAIKVPATGPPIRPVPFIAIGFGVAAGDIGRLVIAAFPIGFRTGFFGSFGRRGEF